jgi:hypothetical protein
MRNRRTPIFTVRGNSRRPANSSARRQVADRLATRSRFQASNS